MDTRDADAFSRYQVIRPLAQGGMGQLYLATDTKLNRNIVLKVLRDEVLSDDYQGYLQQEGLNLARLSHPHIRQLFDIESAGQRTALVLEYVDGRDLRAYLLENSPDYVERLRLLQETAAGLAAAHAAGITHNDLKAENVLVANDGTVKVSDFGLAQSGNSTVQDVKALGALAKSVLQDCADTTDQLSHLLASLTSTVAMNRPTAREAAAAFQACWLESTQAVTAVPKRRGALQPVVAISLIIILAAVGLLAQKLWEADDQQTYVAVLPSTVKNGNRLSDASAQALQSLVDAAIAESLAVDARVLLKRIEVEPDTAQDLQSLGIAQALDEWIASEIECLEAICNVSVMRLSTASGAVLASRTIPVAQDALLDSYQLMRETFPQLYERSSGAPGASPAISEDGMHTFVALLTQRKASASSYADVFESVSKLVDEHPAFLPLYKVYSDTALELFFESGDVSLLSQVDDALLRYASKYGDSDYLAHMRFELAIELGDFSRAARELELMNTLGADRVLLYELTGLYHGRQGENDLAEPFLQKAVKLRPSRSAYFRLGVNYYVAGDLARADATLTALNQAFGADQKSLNMLGLIHLDQGDLKLASRFFEGSVGLMPGPLQRSNLGLTRMLLRDYSGAAALFETLVAEGSRDPAILLNLADSYALGGAPERAEMYYRMIIELHNDGTMPVDLKSLSQAYAHLGQYEEAIALLSEIEASGERYEQAFNTALIYTIARQNLAALSAVETALSEGFGAVWFTLPWFDDLCRERGFSEALGSHGLDNRCAGVYIPASGTTND
ncbi:MAG: protein kinase [Pseudomonadota bacterium]